MRQKIGAVSNSQMIRPFFYRYSLLCLLLEIICLWTFPPLVHADGFPIIGVLHIGGRPEALALDLQTHFLYIAGEAPGQLTGFDTLTGSVRWRLQLGTVTDVQADSQHHLVYAAINLHNKGNALVVVEGSSGKILAQLPVAPGDNSVVLNTSKHRAYILNRDNSTMYRWTFPATWPQDAAHQLTSIQTQQTHLEGHPGALGLNSRLGRLYIGDQSNRTLTVMDEESQRALATIPIAELPLPPIRVDEATNYIYVLCSTGQELDVIDGKNNTVLAHTPVAPYPEGLATATTTGRIYIANEGEREGGPGGPAGTTLSVLDGHSFALLGTLNVGRAPNGVEADPTLQRVYVALEESGAVVEVSDSTDLPLKADTSAQRAQNAQQALVGLQWATTFTLVVMLLTCLGATLSALLQRRRGRESPQNPPAAVSARAGAHTPQP